MTAPRWSDDHGGFWEATSHEAVCAVAREASVFSSAQSVHVPPTGLYTRGIRIFALEHDGDEHWDQRQVLAAAAGAKPSSVPVDLIESCLTPLMDALDWSQPVDLMEALANPLPLDVIFALIGADPEFKAEMKELVDALLRRTSSTHGDPAARVHDIARTMVERRLAAPREDWITGLSSVIVCGASLKQDEQVAAVVSLITGGHHSTSRGLGSLLARVVTEPGLRDALLADPTLIPAAVDETLRLHTPLPEFSRTAVSTSEVLGTTVEEGQQVSMRYDSANLDPAVFQDPTAFRLDRRRSQHLAFGFGPHRCVGTHLARAEMQMALEAVLARAPGVRLVQQVAWAGPAEPSAVWVSC